MKVRLIFNDGSEFITSIEEGILKDQMSRPQTQRRYIYGIEFSEVKEVEVLNV